mgnify:FL=1
MRFANSYGFFSVDAMPNQPSIAWCSDFTVHLKNRGKGLAHKLKAYQNDVLQVQGFTFALCTVKVSNVAQIRVLVKAGWSHKTTFNDARTGELIQLWSYAIDQSRCVY